MFATSWLVGTATPTKEFNVVHDRTFTIAAVFSTGTEDAKKKRAMTGEDALRRR